MKVYILIKTRVGSSNDTLKEVEKVVDKAYLLWGVYDIIAEVEGIKEEILNIRTKIKQIKEVKTTLTLIKLEK